MAIKPTDIIIYLDDERYLVDSVDWYNKPVKEARLPAYWENFKQHTFSLIDPEDKKDWKRYHSVQQKAIACELAKHNIEYKESKRGPYLKFKHEADITFFKLRWA